MKRKELSRSSTQLIPNFIQRLCSFLSFNSQQKRVGLFSSNFNYKTVEEGKKSKQVGGHRQNAPTKTNFSKQVVYFQDIFKQ